MKEKKKKQKEGKKEALWLQLKKTNDLFFEEINFCEEKLTAFTLGSASFHSFYVYSSYQGSML